LVLIPAYPEPTAVGLVHRVMCSVLKLVQEAARGRIYSVPLPTQKMSIAKFVLIFDMKNGEILCILWATRLCAFF